MPGKRTSSRQVPSGSPRSVRGAGRNPQPRQSSSPIGTSASVPQDLHDHSRQDHAAKSQSDPADRDPAHLLAYAITRPRSARSEHPGPTRTRSEPSEQAGLLRFLALTTEYGERQRRPETNVSLSARIADSLRREIGGAPAPTRRRLIGSGAPGQARLD